MGISAPEMPLPWDSIYLERSSTFYFLRDQMLNDGYISCIMIKSFILSSFSFSGHFAAVNINLVTVLHPSEGNISFQPQIIFTMAQRTQLEIIILSLIISFFCFTSELFTVSLQILKLMRQGEPKAEWRRGDEACAAPARAQPRQENESKLWKAERAVRDWPHLGWQPHKQWLSSFQREREVVVFNGEIFRQLLFWWHRRGGERVRLWDSYIGGF